MQLVRIEHERCSEIQAHTFVLAPDEWSQDDIRKAVRRAEGAYQAVLNQVKEETAAARPPYEAYMYSVERLAERYPGKTIEEIQALREAEKTEYRQWQEYRRRTELHFESFLREEGFGSIYGKEEEGGPFTVTVYWGHQHGTTIYYNDPETNVIGVWSDSNARDTSLTPRELVEGREDEDEDEFAS